MASFAIQVQDNGGTPRLALQKVGAGTKYYSGNLVEYPGDPDDPPYDGYWWPMLVTSSGTPSVSRLAIVVNWGGTLYWFQPDATGTTTANSVMALFKNGESGLRIWGTSGRYSDYNY